MKFRRIASVAAASAMALSVMAVSASAADYNAFLMYADNDWAWSHMSEGISGDTTVSGYGTYTVSADCEAMQGANANGALVFCVDIVGGGAEFTVDNTVATIDSILVDGVSLDVDNSKIVYGDIEENGNFRIEIKNAYGQTGDLTNEHYCPIDSDKCNPANLVEVTFTLADPNAAAEAPAEEEAVAEAPAAEETVAEAPAADTAATTPAATGNTSAAALAGVMAVAAAAAIAVKKSK